MNDFFFRTALPGLALALALTCSALPAQDAAAEAPLASGPAAGAALTPVSCYATDGPFSGQEFDAAATLGASPSALLFIHELTRNTAPVLRGLDDLATEFSILGFKSHTVMLSGDRTAAEAQLKRVNGSLRLANPIVLSIDGAEGPGNYALNRKAALTLVFAKEGKVTRSLALTDTGPNDLPVIRSAIEEVAGEIPDDEAALKNLIAGALPSDPEALKALAATQSLELRRLRERIAMLQRENREAGMRRQPAPQRPLRAENQPPRDTPAVKREGKPPEDPELLSSLRSYIRKTNDKARTDEVFAAIKERAAQSDELKSETIEMFRLMLSIDYGTGYAQELAKAYLKEEGPAGKDE